MKLNAKKNMPKRAKKSSRDKKSRSHKKNNQHTTADERKLRSNVEESLPRKIEPPEEETPVNLLYLEKDRVLSSNVSSELEEEPSGSNEDDYIMPPEAIKKEVEEFWKQSAQTISNISQMNGRWKMLFLQKYEAGEADQSTYDEIGQSASSEGHERIPKIEDISYINSAKIKRDKKWVRKMNPLSLHYTDKKRPYLKCPACGATFFSPNTYQRHLLSHVHNTTREGNYMCNFCNYSNTELGMLFAHLTKHQNQCESCNESLLRKDNYERHYQCSIICNRFDTSLKRDHHGMFVCIVCDLVFDLSAQLEKHWFKHTCRKQKSYQCNECSGMYENMETLRNHTCLKCPICGEVYESLHRLKVHTMWTKHNLKCSICSYEFILSMDHEKHMALHRKVYQPMKDYMHCLRAADGQTYQCNLCDKIFYALRLLLTHLREEHDVGNVKVEEDDDRMEDDNYVLKGDAIDIVVVPDFKDSSSYFDTCNELESLQEETEYDTVS